MHESVLRLVVEGDDGDDATVDTMESGRVKMHVEWLKQCYLRLQGWDKSEATYKDLVNAILRMEEYRHRPEWQGVRGVEHWDKREPASDNVGKFVVPTTWEFEDPEEAERRDQAGELASAKRSGMGMKRATSNWGLSSFHHVWNGDQENQVSYNSNGNGRAAKPVILDGDDDGYESAAEEVEGANGSGKAGTFAQGKEGVRV